MSKGLKFHEAKLNSALLETLVRSFEGWQNERKLEFERQLKSVPRTARSRWLQERYDLEHRSTESQATRQLYEFLLTSIETNLAEINQLKNDNREFRWVVSRVGCESELHRVILDYAAQLGASASELKKDQKSLNLWLDEEAMNDRFTKGVGEQELLLVFTLNRLTQVTQEIFHLATRFHTESRKQDAVGADIILPDNVAKEIWTRLNLENRVLPVVQYEGDNRLNAAALKCLRKAISHLPPQGASASFDPGVRVLINRMAMDADADVWIQCEAITICTQLDQATSISFLEQRARTVHGTDDIFVRRHVWQLLERQLATQPQLKIDFASRKEPSPFVRQAIASAALASSCPSARQRFLELGLNDPTEQVRAATLACALNKQLSWEQVCRALELIAHVLQREKNPFVLRTAFHVSVCVLQKLTNDLDASHLAEVIAIYRDRFEPAIRHHECSNEAINVRRWAAQTCEKLWAILDSDVAELIEELKASISKTDRGKVATIPKRILAVHSEDVVGRALSVIAIEDFGFELKRGLFGTKIRRGDHFGFRLWRFWYEVTHTATDKRQGLRHTTGRISTSTVRVPSQICGELSETKVPGEPLNIAEDGTWRPFLPLLDDFVSILNMGWFRQKETKFYSSQGITTVKSPRSWLAKLRSFYSLSFKFATIAKLRNWNGDSWPQHQYIKSIRNLGFEVSFERHGDAIFRQAPRDSSVEVFFEKEQKTNSTPSEERQSSANPCNVATITVAADQNNLAQSFAEVFFDFARYFRSPFENSLPQLVVFASVILLLFLGRHFWENYRFRKARRKIPLSIGGWGTRGKSGTERLKAALLGVMGHGLVSKTTGCEAMFIHGVAHGEPLEIPLFRPYDKATIWEQKDLIVNASKMNPSVFLWECMALTPAYVDVLQRQWTQDDLGTITNTYPDHEDVQGPAGHDVAKTISGFVPVNSHMITTELEMLPFVSDSCRNADTSLESIGWLESGLITEDVLDRFPYEEHPNNIALVAAMGAHLGCKYEYSLKAMADFLVPDLGVLKTHPVSNIKHRRIEFTNGCSANERFGCMGNWKRLGFDSVDPWEQPDTWICGVVNNRADRVPRSKVFAKIIVEDINADRFFLIGNNLDGLQSFIKEALNSKVDSMSLKLQSGQWDLKHALETLQQEAWNLRQPITKLHVEDRIRAMTKSADQIRVEAQVLHSNPAKIKEVVDATTGRIVEFKKQSVTAQQTYENLKKKIQSTTAANADQADIAFREWYVSCYMQKIVVVPKYEATGEEIIGRIVEEVPPGFLAKIMGLQNIKGTGLDFVYRFQAWDTCFDACEALLENNAELAQKGLNTLLAMPEIGQLCQELVATTINEAQKNPAIKRADIQKQLDTLREKLNANISHDSDSILNDSGDTERGKTRKIMDWAVDNAKQYLDVNDSLRRRENADLIYRELAACRISRQRAVTELRKINKRQKK